MITSIKTSKEIEEIAYLGNIIWHEAYASILTEDQIEYMVENFQSVKAIKEQIAHGYEYFIISLDGKNVGYCGVEIQSDNKMYLSKMYLLASAHGKGLFKEMLNHLISISKDKGVSAIWLTVNRNNARAIAAYNKNGFKTIRTQISDIGNGFVMDDFVMELTL